MRTALEILDGRRPLPHLAPHVTPAVLRYLAAGAPRQLRPRTPRAAGQGTGMRSLHVSLPGRADAEVAAVCRIAGRVRAVAAHLERTSTGDWHCTALRIL
ncbi:hypothetical protein GCM10009836_66720 [Pseudonocardia ailaonensis]|uniref:Uncharacterized protein n=1 Tax=Pseudonocardia ailaonensis TaxID=367279 RepID=A0ABN2NPZ0_9PSEU